MNTNTRIKLTDSLMSSIQKVSEGNPGAMMVCTTMSKECPKIDPDAAFGEIGCLLSLDSHAIYGASIWMLYKDVCGEDIVKTLAVLRAVQLGLMEEEKLIYAIGNYGKGIDVNHIYDLVKEKLPNFNNTNE